jgi:mono/diheme cytochrome c family protein
LIRVKFVGAGHESLSRVEHGDIGMRAALVTILGLLSIAAPALGQESGNAGRGLVYARQACSDCHAVAADQRVSPDPKAPSFQSVADTPGMTRIAVNVWLHSSHPTMPQLIIDAERIDDLAAYLATLRKASK